MSTLLYGCVYAVNVTNKYGENVTFDVHQGVCYTVFELKTWSEIALFPVAEYRTWFHPMFFFLLFIHIFIYLQ